MKYRLVRTADCPPGLFRVKATRSFGEVTEGEFGGFVASVANLSQDGDCWVHDDACVRDDALVSDASHIYGDAQVFDRALVGGRSIVSDSAWVFGDAVLEDCWVNGMAWVCNRASAKNARIVRGATLAGQAQVNDCFIGGLAMVAGHAQIDHGLVTIPTGDIAWRDQIEVTACGTQWGVYGQSTIMGDTVLALRPELGVWFGESESREWMPDRLREQDMLDDELEFFQRVELFLSDPV